MTTPRLVIFDVDGTLIDSEAHIVASMEVAFAASALPPPAHDQIRAVVGLSVPEAMTALLPDQPDRIADLVTAYKHAFSSLRDRFDGMVLAPLFPGARDVLDQLATEGDTVLAIATGKSRRGLDFVIDLHGLDRYFRSTQVADDHPSKPHPAMIAACLAETGIAPDRAVMVGDTTFDIEMARHAGIAAIGVGWGHHLPDMLHQAGAAAVLDSFAALPAALDRICPAA
jgi:phosphoglycolate phosphatase